tara:strand:- start:1404 stop:1559 length:156 start_codon:yes stop_codon:yes gene_type:complete
MQVARLRASDPNAEILQQPLVIEQSVVGNPIVAGNKTSTGMRFDFTDGIHT